MAQTTTVAFHSRGFYFIGVGTLIAMFGELSSWWLATSTVNLIIRVGVIALIYGNLRVWLDRKAASQKVSKKKRAS